MKTEQRHRVMWTIIFWGSLWGTAEATLGCVFHAFSFALPGLPGMVMFPIAFYFMRKVFQETDRLSAVFFTAALTAGIKLADLLLPFMPPIYTLNPAISILLESLAVIFYFKVYYRREREVRLVEVLTAAAAWRAAYVLLYSLPIYFLVADGLFYYGWHQVLRFLSFDTVLNGVVIYFYLKMANPRKEWRFSGSTLRLAAAAVSVLALAICAELIFAYI